MKRLIIILLVLATQFTFANDAEKQIYAIFKNINIGMSKEAVKTELTKQKRDFRKSKIYKDGLSFNVPFKTYKGTYSVRPHIIFNNDTVSSTIIHEEHLRKQERFNIYSYLLDKCDKCTDEEIDDDGVPYIGMFYKRMILSYSNDGMIFISLE